MLAFLLVHLRSGNSDFYKYPVIQWVKDKHPEVMVLDVDNASDELLISYACKLITEEDKKIIYFIPDNPDAPLGAALRIVETIISAEKATIQVLSEGQHRRLESILLARPHIPFSVSLDVIQHQSAITGFYAI